MSLLSLLSSPGLCLVVAALVGSSVSVPLCLWCCLAVCSCRCCPLSLFPWWSPCLCCFRRCFSRCSCVSSVPCDTPAIVLTVLRTRTQGSHHTERPNMKWRWKQVHSELERTTRAFAFEAASLGSRHNRFFLRAAWVYFPGTGTDPVDYTTGQCESVNFLVQPYCLSPAFFFASCG